MAKRRRAGRGESLFSQQAVVSRLASKSTEVNNIKTIANREAALQLEISDISKGIQGLGEEEVVFILSCKLTLKGLMTLIKAIKHVPAPYNQVGHKDFGRLRLYVIHKLMEKTGLALLKTDLEVYVQLVETYCGSLVAAEMDRHFNESLWSLTEEEDFYFNSFMCCPVKECLSCGLSLSLSNKPSKATVFTLDGPTPSTKLVLRCRECDMAYGIGSYKDRAGEHLYDKSLGVKVIEVSNVTYIDQVLYEWIPSFGNHCWVSFSGFSEAYNEVNMRNINRYSLAVGATEVDNDVDNDIPVLAQEDNEQPTPGQNILKDKSSKGIIPGQLSPKIVANAFWKEEVHREMIELQISKDWIFKDTPGHMCGTIETVMEYADKIRSASLYSHSCSGPCKDRGCGSFYVADGNWKLRHAHCMWKVPVNVSGFGTVNYPSVCPLTPVRGKAFCKVHMDIAKKENVKTEMKEFLRSCGINEEESSETGILTSSNIEAVEKRLDQLVKGTEIEMADATTFQGTKEFLQTHPGFVKDNDDNAVVCNKDTGGKVGLQCWSRGSMWIVSGGGIIEYLQPLYRSESPTQAFVIFICWIHLKFHTLVEKGIAHKEIVNTISETVLSYDNMCNVDRMKITKKDLPFPPPLDKAWANIGKVIDRLHLRNHKDPRCKKKFDPDKKINKEYNSMAAEQTFVWASRFKKIVCAMPRLHHFFYLHRAIKRRNAYTERCHQMNRTPVLPKLTKDHYKK